MLAKTNQPTLNHVAFEMPEFEFGDARHGPHEGRRLSDRMGPGPPWAGRQCLRLFLRADEVPLEYTAEVLQVDDSYQPRPSSYWKFAPGRSDQWGITQPRSARYYRVQRLFGYTADGHRLRLRARCAIHASRMLWSAPIKITVREKSPCAARFQLLPWHLLCAAFSAQAQDYPTRPIRALTTASAGGISDVFMRALGDKLGARLGQPIVVENRPGGMQNVGARACQDAAPDGYTICIINADPIIYNQFLIKDMPFDPVHGLQPITDLFDLIHTWW